MNKTEKNLVSAIKGGNYDEATGAFTKFSALQSTTDEQSNDYFDKVEALKEVKLDEVVESKEEPKEVVQEVEPIEVVAPRVEKRGVKAKSKSRKEVEAAFNKAFEVAMVYKQDNRNTPDGRFAMKLVNQLSLIKKRLLR